MNPDDARAGDREQSTPLVVGADPLLADLLARLATTARLVFLAGLPGTGKSLLAHQLAHLAYDRGRVLHFLQWDVARPVFEASAGGARYPIVAGVTHAVVRKAVGLWSRRAIAAWDREHQGDRHLLIGETPLIGERFMALARRGHDDAETILASIGCRFVLPVPSADVRAFLEAERERRAVAPLHPREREDAPPAVLRGLWRELIRIAPALGVAGRCEPSPTADVAAYDAALYRRVFEVLLRHRHVDVAPVDRVLPTRELSVYDLAVPRDEVMPTQAEANALIGEVEARYPDPRALDDEISRWYVA